MAKILEIAGKTLKVMGWVFLFFTIFLVITGFFIYRDVMDLKKNFMNSSKLFLLEDEGKFLAGAQMYGFDLEKDLPHMLTKEEIDELNNLVGNGGYKKVLGSHYKIIIVRLDAFNALSDEISIGNFKITSRENLFSLLRSDSPIEDFLGNNGELPEDAIDDAAFKTVLFFGAFGVLVKEKGPFYILNEYKKGNVLVYPETFTFKTIRFLPVSTAEKIANQNKEKFISK